MAEVIDSKTKIVLFKHEGAIVEGDPQSTPRHRVYGLLAALKRTHMAGIQNGILTNTTPLVEVEGDMARLSIPKKSIDRIQAAEKTDGINYHDRRMFMPTLMWLYSEDLTRNQAVFIGTSLEDYHAAQDAHIKFVGLEGQVTAEEFGEANAPSIPSLTDLLKK